MRPLYLFLRWLFLRFPCCPHHLFFGIVGGIYPGEISVQVTSVYGHNLCATCLGVCTGHDELLLPK